MSESVEQAALRRADTDWQGRARREAAAIIVEAMPDVTTQDYPRIVELVAIGWLQGANFGSHDTLARFDDAFLGMRAAL